MMRNVMIIASATLLGACGGSTAPETVGSVAPPAGPASTHSFVTPVDVKTYEGLGGVQAFQYFTDSNKNGQGGQLYAGDANTVRDSGISVTYNPRDAIFELTVARPLGLVNLTGSRFQDPAHRTDFGGAREPQAGVPEFDAARQIQYLQFGSGSGSLLPTTDPAYTAAAAQSDYAVGAKAYTSDTSTFFYQKPGTTTKYVTYAGFVRNQITATEQQDDPALPVYLRQSYSLSRAAFVFGERTAVSAVPRSGSGTFSGDMIASMVFNPDIDTTPGAPTYFQWIIGSQTTNVNFATLGVSTTMTGTVTAPTIDAYTSGATSLAGGSTFTAAATSTIDLVGKGGFTGQFTTVRFARAGLPDFVVVIAGSSLDGAFFGPGAEEIGGGFRIVGGTPDERIDILGAFTGKK